MRAMFMERIFIMFENGLMFLRNRGAASVAAAIAAASIDTKYHYQL